MFSKLSSAITEWITRKRMEVGLVMGSCLIILCIAHIVTISSPPPRFDEAVVSNLISTGSFSLWHKTFNNAQRSRMDLLYAVGFVPNEFKVFAAAQHAFGIGFWQQRLPGAASGLASLILFVLITRKLHMPLAGQLSALMLGCSYVFFWSTHFARQETIIMLISFMNIYWLISDHPSNWLALILGGLYAFCFSLHPITLIPWITLLVLILTWHDRRISVLFTHRRYLWWGGGLVLGLFAYIAQIDIEQAIMSLTVAKNITYAGFPLLRYQWDILGLLDHLARQVGWYPGMALFPYVVASGFGLAAVELRRFNQRTRQERLLISAHLAGLVAFTCLAASESLSYELFFYPWLILFLIFSSVHWISSADQYNETDALIVFAGLLLFGTADNRTSLNVPTFAFLSWLILGAILQLKREWKMVSFLFIGIFLLRCLDGNGYVSAGSFMYHLLHKPWVTTFSVVWPMALLCTDGRIRFSKFYIRGRAIGFFVVCLLLVNFVSEGSYCVNRIRMPLYTPDADLVINDLRSGKRIIAPAEFWLYEPSPDLQDHSVLYLGKALFSETYNPLWSMLRFKPDYVLWPDDWMKILIHDARRLKRHKVSIREDRLYDLPFGKYRKLYIHEISELAQEWPSASTEED